MPEPTTARQIAEILLATDGLGKTGNEVNITCENADAANTLLDLLMRLTDEEVPHG